MTYGEEPRWELVPDTEFIVSGTDDMELVGFLEFSDDVLCVCLHQGDSSGAESLMQDDTASFSEQLREYRDIPF